jgi:hypothetical protein
MTSPVDRYTQAVRYAFAYVQESWIFASKGGVGVASYFSMGAATPALTLLSENYEDGTLYARASIFDLQEQADLMVALTPGELRVGLMLSEAMAYAAPELPEAISTGYDGNPARLVRTLANGRMMWDHFFHDAPFSAKWMAKAVDGDHTKLHLMAVRLRYIIETRWRTAMDALVGVGGIRPQGCGKYSLAARRQVDLADLCSRFGVIVLDGPRRFDMSGQTEWMSLLVVPGNAIQALQADVKNIDPDAVLKPVDESIF